MNKRDPVTVEKSIFSVFEKAEKVILLLLERLEVDQLISRAKLKQETES